MGLAAATGCGKRTESERDLSWYTYDFWHRHYEAAVGTYKEIDPSGRFHRPLIPLAAPCPVDYTPPPGTPVPTVARVRGNAVRLLCSGLVHLAADWRRMLAREMATEEERTNMVTERLRGSYQSAQRTKQARMAEVCIIAPRKKRQRTGHGSSSSLASAASAWGKGSSAAPTSSAAPKVKLLQGIGLLPQKASSLGARAKAAAGYGGAAKPSAGRSLGGGGAAGKVSKQVVVVHKAVSAGHLAARSSAGLKAGLLKSPPTAARPPAGKAASSPSQARPSPSQQQRSTGTAAPGTTSRTAGGAAPPPRDTLLVGRGQPSGGPEAAGGEALPSKAAPGVAAGQGMGGGVSAGPNPPPLGNSRGPGQTGSLPAGFLASRGAAALTASTPFQDLAPVKKVGVVKPGQVGAGVGAAAPADTPRQRLLEAHQRQQTKARVR
ncbi:hypothetical protein QJQ45_019348 [Haematococcus lacustris]|nr:hypothetical protein QJQ45_019348 [Haematococcus lacustris]